MCRVLRRGTVSSLILQASQEGSNEVVVVKHLRGLRGAHPFRSSKAAFSNQLPLVVLTLGLLLLKWMPWVVQVLNALNLEKSDMTRIVRVLCRNLVPLLPPNPLPEVVTIGPKMMVVDLDSRTKALRGVEGRRHSSTITKAPGGEGEGKSNRRPPNGLK
ncbi:uncharacterized protein G2W53_028478 [Senna tora]|uniref:Uncharacterized protein n=1 Tax=Senna tora TaxID=362788 RepID=A0A834T2E4_9FABA|nr:uncharacterized protein G2W53_028478 [Senna tora]